MSIVCHATRAPGTCGTCRHANQGTAEFARGLIACQLGAAELSEATHCRVDFKPPDREVSYFLYEPFDGENCTFGSHDGTLEVAVVDDA